MELSYHAVDDNIEQYIYCHKHMMLRMTIYVNFYRYTVLYIFSIRLSPGSARELIPAFPSIELNKINEHLGRQETPYSPLHTVHIQY